MIQKEWLDASPYGLDFTVNNSQRPVSTSVSVNRWEKPLTSRLDLSRCQWDVQRNRSSGWNHD
ncbi:unnamed protein product [Arabis nemorensis]|uniref:Uncharacterized protein n=1 Tax=Arabis nemorensis TaxID=586526 RepID=A0A565B869_9BRAS|nr:unnamed protein product [Arabis nemorensis]